MELLEHWKPVPGFEWLYEVSKVGRVRALPAITNRRIGRSKNNGAELRRFVAANGYLTVHLCRGSKKHPRTVHSLVADAFLGTRPCSAVVRHLDGDATNPRRSNLAYGTPKENQDDRIMHGTDCRGEKHPAAKLTADSVRAIKARIAAGEMKTAIAADYGVSRYAISDIARGRSWTHI